MSRYSHGRRVTDPKPAGRGVPTEAFYGAGLTELASAWDTMRKARTSLRRAEHRINEADIIPNMPVPDTSDINNSQQNIVVDRVPKLHISEDVQESGHGTYIDNQGRTNFFKAKMYPSRKVSRMEDKYREDETQRYQTGLKSTLDSVPTRSMYVTQSNQRANQSQHGTTMDYTNMTDSRAIRETEVRFLNDGLSTSTRDQTRAPRTTHVEVSVPGAVPLTLKPGRYTTAVRNNVETSSQGSTESESRDFVVMRNGDLVRKENMRKIVPRTIQQDNTYTKGSGSEDSLHDKQKKKFNLNFDAEGLRKLREKIKAQREAAKINALNGEIESQPTRNLHEEHEEVVPKTYDLYDTDRQAAKFRKVTAGPPVPSYKGFNEAETRLKTLDGKVINITEVKRKIKPKRLRPSPQLLDKANQQKATVDKDKETKPKKMPRVTAPAKKPSKMDKKDIITTSSWRAGQKLVLQELGPNRMPRTSDSPPQKDKTEDNKNNRSGHSLEHDTTLNDLEMKEVDQDKMRETNENQPKALSSEARTVLMDLQLDDGTGERNNERMEDKDKHENKRDRSRSHSSSRRRKAQKEEESKVSLQKVRHYDTNEVRRYMAKQRAERKKKQQEEEEARVRASEAKQKHLEELYKKQKETATKPVDVAKEKQKSSSGSDKENQGSGSRKVQPAWSDTDSTLTADSVDESAQQNEKDTTYTKEGSQDNEKCDDGKPELVRGKFKVDQVKVDEIIEKYLQQEREKNRMKDSGIGTATVDAIKDHKDLHALGSTSQPSAFSRPNTESVGLRKPDGTNMRQTTAYPSANSSRNARIQAIQATAASLQAKLKQGTQAITKEMGLGTYTVPEAWTQLQHPTISNHLPGDLDYMTRHDRLAGARTDKPVFDGDLPGVSNVSEHISSLTHEREVSDAAVKIQAAYRGHAVRQTVGWKLAPKKAKAQEDKAFESEDSMLSDSTLTEDYNENPVAKIGDVMASRLYHASATDTDDSIVAEPPADRRPLPKYVWDKPTGDPYSILNIYAKRSERTKQLAKEIFAPDTDDSTVSLSSDVSSLSEAVDNHLPQSLRSVGTKSPVSQRSKSQAPYRIKSPVSQRTKSPVSHRTKTPELQSYQDDFTSVASSQPASRKEAVGAAADMTDPQVRPFGSATGKDDDEDTIEGSLTPSNDSDVKKEESSPDLSLVPSPRGRPSTTGVESDISSLADEPATPLRQPRGTAISPRPLQHQEMYSSYATGRLSPSGLERRLVAELNLLDGMEESMRQLTDVERTRAVSMAQQETVSLAQILKARQQGHMREMEGLQLKAREESLAAAQQLHQAQQKGAEATSAMAEMRAAQVNQQAADRLVQAQTEAARATAEAARQLAEARLASMGPDMHRLTVESAASAASAAVEARMKYYHDYNYGYRRPGGATYDRSTQYSVRSNKSHGSSRLDSRTADSSYTSDSFDETYTRSSAPTRSRKERESAKASSVTSDIKTVTDLSVSKTRSVPTAADIPGNERPPRKTDQSDASIRTEPGVAPVSARSKADTVATEIPSDKEDYSIDFENSVTEDVIEEKSFRDVLPSEVHRRKLKREGSQSDVASYSSDEQGMSRRLSIDDISSPFIGEDSFSKFTADMVRQYMKEEEIRAQHQASLLKLRERALKEKTKAELAWLEQQRQHMRDKGKDDLYPAINKKKRGLKMRFQQEQAEIQRLQEANKAASRKRRFLLEQANEINKLHSTTKQMDETSDLLSSPSPHKDYKSDSEMYTEGMSARPPSPDSTRAMQKLKKMKLDQRYLTVREQKLRTRRKHAEELLEWKRRLDEEEAHVYKIEREALALWEQEYKAGKEPSKMADKKADKKTPVPQKPVSKTAAPTKKEGPKNTAAVHSEESVTDEVVSVSSPRQQRHQHSGSESSVPEEVLSDAKSGKSLASSIQEEVVGGSQASSSIPEEVSSGPVTKTADSSDDTIVNSSVNDEYSNETFDSTGEGSQTQTRTEASSKPSAPASPKHIKPPLVTNLGSPRSLRKHSSESESEDSFAVGPSEVASDQSDVEGRIRALTEELKRRKLEAERLKKEADKRHKSRLRQQEVNLKKQIEAYDQLISQTKKELQHELINESPRAVKPMIKQPRHGRRAQESKPTEKQVSPESRRLSESSSFEETSTTPGSSSSSRQDDSLPSPIKGEPTMGRPSLDAIAELSDSQIRKTSTPDVPDSPAATPREPHTPRAEVVTPRTDVHTPRSEVLSPRDESTQDIPEDLPTPRTETIATEPQVPKLQLDLDESHSKVKFTEDVKREASDLLKEDAQAKASESARSEKTTARSEIPEDISEHVEEESEAVISSKVVKQKDEVFKVAEGKEAAVVEREETPEPKAPVSARSAKSATTAASITEVLSQEYTSDSEAHTHSEKSETSRHSEQSELSKRSEYSEVSRKSETASYSTTNSKTAEEHSYTEDFSDSTVSSRSEVVAAPVEKSEKSKEQLPEAPSKQGKDEEEETEEDISEMLSVHSDSEEKAAELTFDLHIGAKPYPEGEIDAKEKPTPKSEEALSEPKSQGAAVEEDKTQVTETKDTSVELDRIVDKSLDRSVDKSLDRSGKDESVHDESNISVASDSSLSRAIEEADKNVKMFMMEEGEKTPKSSPGKAKQDRENLVDDITDTLTKKVLSDTVSTIGKIKRQTEEPRVSPVPPELLEGDRKEETSPRDAQKAVVDLEKGERAAETATQNLFNEAIKELIDIHKKKRRRLSGEEGSEEDKEVEEASRESSGDTSPIPRPPSPVMDNLPSLETSKKTVPTDLDLDFKEMDNLLGIDNDEFYDEVYGLPSSTSSEPAAGGSSPSLPGAALADIQTLTEELFFVVPHKSAEVTHLAEDALQAFWQMRRYGESWENAEPPKEYFTSEDSGSDVESTSRRVYKHLVFDLVGEILQDVYKSEEEVEIAPYMKPPKIQQKYYKGRTPPTTLDSVEPVVTENTLRCFGLHDRSADPKPIRYSLRKKKDRVDDILVQELREEEPDWVNYDADELTVKMQLADSIFDSLLTETASVIGSIYQRRLTAQS